MFNKWTFNLHDCEIWGNELFDDKEKAIEEGAKFAKEEGFDGFYIGYSEKPVIHISGYDLVENIDMQLSEEVGDISQEWYQEIEERDKEKLTDMLNKTFQEWMDKTQNNISCYKVTNIEYIELSQKDKLCANCPNSPDDCGEDADYCLQIAKEDYAKN